MSTSHTFARFALGIAALGFVPSSSTCVWGIGKGTRYEKKKAAFSISGRVVDFDEDDEIRVMLNGVWGEGLSTRCLGIWTVPDARGRFSLKTPQMEFLEPNASRSLELVSTARATLGFKHLSIELVIFRRGKPPTVMEITFYRAIPGHDYDVGDIALGQIDAHPTDYRADGLCSGPDFSCAFDSFPAHARCGTPGCEWVAMGDAAHSCANTCWYACLDPTHPMAVAPGNTPAKASSVLATISSVDLLKDQRAHWYGEIDDALGGGLWWLDFRGTK